jgi:hypothetical protein
VKYLQAGFPRLVVHLEQQRMPLKIPFASQAKVLSLLRLQKQLCPRMIRVGWWENAERIQKLRLR